MGQLSLRLDSNSIKMLSVPVSRNVDTLCYYQFFSATYYIFFAVCYEFVGDEGVVRMKIVLYYRVASVYVFEISSILVLYRSAESMHK